MLATPPQLACSPWRGLSGGEHASMALCSPNEMPVSEGACGTVKVKYLYVLKKKKKKIRKPSRGVSAPSRGW